MSEIDPGTIVDERYHVVSRLGSGGMADVFLAEDQQLGRNVALKLLHRRFAEDPAFVERFRREAQSAAGLQHPNVVSIYDRGAFGGTYYIAMEYLPGRTLKQLIRQEAPLDPIRAIDIAIQILKAARFAHRRGVIHRDLKPHNVMIDDSDHAKVTDFGIARAGASDMTETGSIMGTSQYLSPEQAQGMAVSESSDLYSVAVVLYEMTTGRVPFDGDSPVTIALKHVAEAPVPPSQINPATPLELEQVILWALNKDAAHRPADADQLIGALEQARELIIATARGQRTADMPALAIAGGLVDAPDPPTPMVRPPVAPMPVTPTGEHRVERAGHVNGTGSHEVPPNQKESGRPVWPWLLALVLLIAGGGVAGYFLTRPDKAAIPNVQYETLDVAQTEVQQAGFTVATVNRPDTHPAGIVIGQFPLAHQKIDTGSNVTLTVSSGQGSAPIPSVQDLGESAAKKAIKSAGLTTSRVVDQASATVTEGDAIGTDPPAGTSLPVGTAVTLLVSSGQPPVNVPSVVGETLSAAEGQLNGLNITVTTSQQPTATSPPNTVLSQSQTGKVSAGSTVALVVAVAPTTVDVPTVVGDSEHSAVKTLKAAGFSVSKSTQDVPTRAQSGKVVSQSPASGQAAKGSTVTIIVGRYKPTTTTTNTTPTTTNTTPTTTVTVPTTTSTTP
jgi:serine/threonine-protein kinase